MVILLGDEVISKTFSVPQTIRSYLHTHQLFVSVEACLSHNFKNALKKANKSQCRFAVTIGTNELSHNTALVKDLESGNQTNISFDNLSAYILEQLS